MSSLDRSPQPLPLSALLREGTRDAHTRAERVAFVGSIARGTVSREDYRRLLAALQGVYAELEAGLEAHGAHPLVGPFVQPALFRSEAITRDLEFFGGTGELGLATRTADRYRARLRHVATEQPLLLVAHAYTRYLGDVSGGQILRRGLARGFGLAGTEGLSFYDFEALGDLGAFKARFRAALDALPLSADQREALVTEARLAFELNQALFEALDAAPAEARAG